MPPPKLGQIRCHLRTASKQQNLASRPNRQFRMKRRNARIVCPCDQYGPERLPEDQIQQQRRHDADRARASVNAVSMEPASVWGEAVGRGAGWAAARSVSAAMPRQVDRSRPAAEDWRSDDA